MYPWMSRDELIDAGFPGGYVEQQGRLSPTWFGYSDTAIRGMGSTPAAGTTAVYGALGIGLGIALAAIAMKVSR